MRAEAVFSRESLQCAAAGPVFGFVLRCVDIIVGLEVVNKNYRACHLFGPDLSWGKNG